jgi:hypothetical protein
MKTLKNIFGKNKKNEKYNSNNNIIKYNQSEVEGFLVYSENEPIRNDSKKEFKDFINPYDIKDANYYKKMWENVEKSEEQKEAKELFEELWANISKLINNNIIDFSCKY